MVQTTVNVGSYTGSPSPNGTFDQGGNVNEWLDTPASFAPAMRHLRGGDLTTIPDFLEGRLRLTVDPIGGTGSERFQFGMRVVVPAGVVSVPSNGLLGWTMLLSLLAIIGVGRLRREARLSGRAMR